MSAKWSVVVAAMIAVQKNDAELMGLLGGEHIYRARSTSKIQVPGVYYTVINDDDEENVVRVRVQWDVWAKTAADAAAIEGRLHALMHREVDDVFDGVPMCSRKLPGATVDDEIDNRIHRVVMYEYEIGRDL